MKESRNNFEASFVLPSRTPVYSKSLGNSSDKKNKAVFGSINQNSKIFFWHLYGDLNLDEIKNALRLLPVNHETNLMNLIRS